MTPSNYQRTRWLTLIGTIITQFALGSVYTWSLFNAYDAEKSGAGIISSDFNLQQLLEFAKDYHPNRDFVYWVRGAEYTLLNLLESDSSNYQQVLFNEMYLVEEFI